MGSKPGKPKSAKRSEQPVQLADIKEFIATEADFYFEMRVLNRLIASQFKPVHAGTYEDPTTEKRRQFDIRAEWGADKYTLLFAVEAKNLRDTSPLLIHAVERDLNEAFHELIGCCFQPGVRGGVGRQMNGQV